MWDNDACMFSCLTHTIFNRSDPQHAYGKFFVDSADKLVNVSVISSTTSAVYTGDRFGCQLSLVNEVCSLGCLGISFSSHALLWAHLQAAQSCGTSEASREAFQAHRACEVSLSQEGRWLSVSTALPSK